MTPLTAGGNHTFTKITEALTPLVIFASPMAPGRAEHG